MTEFKNLSLEDTEYVLNLPYHLAQAGMADDLCALLTEFEFAEHKVSASEPQLLIEDYNFALAPDVQISEKKKDSLRLIQGALRLSAHTLAEDRTQLAGQMLGRLDSNQVPTIKETLEQAKQERTSPWLRPIIPSLRSSRSSLLRTLKGHTGNVNAVTLTPNGQYIVSAAGGSLLSSENSLKIWDLQTGTMLRTLTGHTQRINAVVVTPDDKHIVSASDDTTVKIWDFYTGTQLHNLIGHTKKVNTVVVTPDGQHIISASDDETVKIWDFYTGTQLHNFTGHTAAVTALTLMPDGERIVSGSKDKTIKIWNLVSGKELFTLHNGITEVTTVAVTPNEKYLISNIDDKSLRVWDLEYREGIRRLSW